MAASNGYNRVSNGSVEDHENVADTTGNSTIEKISNGFYNWEDKSSFTSSPDRVRHELFLRRVLDLVLHSAVFQSTSRSHPILEWVEPEVLQKRFPLALKDAPCNHTDLFYLICAVIKYSVKTSHPHFINQLYAGLDPYGLVAEWVVSSLNVSPYTYEVAPVFTLIEIEVLRQLRQVVGFPNGDGVVSPGGSISNMYGLHLARFKACPDIKKRGVSAYPPLVVFTSEDAHYSLQKAVAWLGLGTDNLRAIPCDDRGSILIDELRKGIEESLQRGEKPFAVSVTAGTTVLGGIDPFPEVADICQQYGLWMHVDAAWGGGALFSPKYRHLLNGIERSDSVAWNPHKMMAAPQQCSVFLTRHPDLLSECNAAGAAYLFQKDKFYDTRYDVGDKYLQCGRKADIFKWWFMWKAKGNSGLAKHVDALFDLKAYLMKQLAVKSEEFRLVVKEPQFLNVCFWFIPASLRKHQNDPDFNKKLHQVAPAIKEKMMKKGNMMVGYQTRKQLPNFFRVVIPNSAITTADIDFFLKEISELGSNV